MIKGNFEKATEDFPRIPQSQVKVLNLVGVYCEGLFVLAHCTEQQRPLLKQH
jgi:hypothetical protein